MANQEQQEGFLTRRDAHNLMRGDVISMQKREGLIPFEKIVYTSQFNLRDVDNKPYTYHFKVSSKDVLGQVNEYLSVVNAKKGFHTAFYPLEDVRVEKFPNVVLKESLLAKWREEYERKKQFKN